MVVQATVGVAPTHARDRRHGEDLEGMGGTRMAAEGTGMYLEGGAGMVVEAEEEDTEVEEDMAEVMEEIEADMEVTEVDMVEIGDMVEVDIAEVVGDTDRDHPQGEDHHLDDDHLHTPVLPPARYLAPDRLHPDAKANNPTHDPYPLLDPVPALPLDGNAVLLAAILGRYRGQRVVRQQRRGEALFRGAGVGVRQGGERGALACAV